MDSFIFFDLDGTLTDPKVGITASIRYALEAVGSEAAVEDDLTWCIGPPLLASLEKLVGIQLAPAALDAYRERFSEIGWSENTPYQGIKNTLALLNTDGHQLFVATSKPHVYAHKILEHFELGSYFLDIFGAELDGTRSDKSELLAYALSKTTCSGYTSMVGDRSHDILGALSNGIEPVGVTYGYGSLQELLQAGATTIMHSPTELRDHFSRTLTHKPIKKKDMRNF